MAVAAFRGVGIRPAGSAPVRASPRPQITRLHVGALAAGVLVLLITGWPVAALATVGTVAFIPKVLGGDKASKQVITTSEALADWTRRLRDPFGSGGAGGPRARCRCRWGERV